MKLIRMGLAIAMLLTVSGFALIARNNAPAGVRMAEAAKKLLDQLSPEQRKKATYTFEDAERINWHFVPRQDKDKKFTRNGVRVEEMTEEQTKAMLELLQTGTSESGYTQATTIMGLESILKELEKNGAMVRNPGWYFVTIFGTPGNTGSWGWRVEGHHMSLNFRIDNGVVTATTPFFFGANPAELKSGPKKGQRTLSDVEDLAINLFKSLDESQKKIAFQDKQFADVQEIPVAKVGEPVGIPASKLTDAQKVTLRKLIESYANRLPGDLAELELNRVQEAGIDKVTFGYAGGTEPGQPHTYRVHGPTFVIEFLNVQADASGNIANHIHSSWRNLSGDFGNKP